MLVLAVVNGSVVLFQPAPAADEEPTFVPNRVFVSSAGTQSILEITLRDLPEPVTALPPPPPGVTGVTGLELPEFVTGLLIPEDLLFGPGGLLYSTDRGTNLVTSYDPDGMPVSTFGLGTGLDEPSGLAFGPLGELFVSSFGTDEVFVFDVLGAGPVAGDGGPPTIGDPALDGPAGLAFDLNGQLYVSSYNTDEILVFDPSGVLVDAISDPALDGPWGRAIGRNGNLYVASSDTDRVLIFDSAGNLVDSLGTDALLDEPADLVFGPNGFLFVSSSANDQLVTFNRDGDGFILVGPGGNMQEPRGLAFAPFMMSMSLSGRITPRDGLETKARSEGTLTVQPGSGVMMMLLDDPDPEKPDPVISAFGTPAMVFYGYEVFADDESTNRVFHGAMTPDDARGAGVGTLLLELKGQLDETEFGPKNGSGYLQRAGEGGILDAKVKAKAPKQKKQKK
jgi:hypothetical protein